MKIKHLLSAGLLLTQTALQAQLCNTPTAVATVHGNEIMALSANNGGMFSDGSQAFFQVPYNPNVQQQTATIYATGLWMTAYDGGGNLLGAVRTYGSNGADYFAGPLSDTFAQTDSTSCSNFDLVWHVTRVQVEALIADYNDDGIVQTAAVSQLLIWPGRNNPHFAGLMGYQLPSGRDFAPFYDHNQDGIYDPLQGDYPVFEDGDPDAIASEMTWSVFNDNGNMHTESNMQAMYVEVQLTTYALYCPYDLLLNNTLFTKYKFVNHNNLTLTNCAYGLWCDFDLGNYNDDYLGAAPSLNATFAYNADAIDENVSGVLGYGQKPPVQSVMFLNQPLYKAMVYENSNDPTNGNPSNPLAYHRLLHGYMNDGSIPTWNGQAISHFYSDAPTDTASGSFSMTGLALVPNDFRMVMSMIVDTLFPNTSFSLDAAYVYHRDTFLADNIEMTDLVYTDLPQVQNWYDNGYPVSCFPTQHINAQRALETMDKTLKLYPNPNNGCFYIKLPDENAYQFRIFDLAGKSLYEELLNGSKSHSIELLNLQAGMYFYQVANEKETYSGKMIISKQ